LTDPDDLTLNLAAFLPISLSNGPGRRAVVWVQGCPFRCKGCWNPETLPFVDRHVVSVGALAAKITSRSDLDGVTFSGGEPFAQAAALAMLGRRLRVSGLSVVCYTGYEYEALLRSARSDWHELLSVVDLLIDGPYLPHLRARLPLRGSANQRLIFLTQVLKSSVPAAGQRFEVQIDPGGVVATTGFPPLGGGMLSKKLQEYGVVLKEDSRPDAMSRHGDL
jgi:anaerobic ribonucleoside-triphosphate reductase activating protein